jgi:CheY-like chemotaxis protein
LAKYKPNAIILTVENSPENPEPYFHYEQVQSWLAEQNLTIPIWMIVRPQDEEIAIKAMYKGLADYFFTDRLSRIATIAARLVGGDEQAFEPVDLNQIMEAYLGGYRMSFEGQAVDLIFLPGADLPKVRGESGSLTQAVFSIFRDAVESAPSGTMTNARTYLQAVKGEVCLEIKLTGEAFQAESETKSRAIIENSFDLMMARKIVERHNGRIDIDQGVDADIQICVSFPAILEKHKKGNFNLLVVENSHLMRSILKEALENEGFTVLVAENGAAALEIMAEYQPGLIISDVAMPTMDGFAFFEAVRQRPQWQDIPFIFVTGQSEQKTELNTRALRGASYLIKPIILEELLVAVYSRLPA